MNKPSLKFHYTLRIRYAEIDAQGIVFNAHYLTYFDTTLTEFFRRLGILFSPQNVSTLDYDYHLVKSVVEYHMPIHFDEVIDIYVGVARIGNSSLTFKLFIYVDDEETPRTSGEIIWVHANRNTGKSVSLPVDVIETLQPYLINESKL
jgi:acyl-CoA thioester hydrolase